MKFLKIRSLRRPYEGSVQIFNLLGIICEPSKGTSKAYLEYSSLGNLVGAT